MRVDFNPDDFETVTKRTATGVCWTLIRKQPECVCSMPWASPTPRPICPTHGKPAESVFAPPIYFGSDREWKDKSGHFSQETQ